MLIYCDYSLIYELVFGLNWMIRPINIVVRNSFSYAIIKIEFLSLIFYNRFIGL